MREVYEFRIAAEFAGLLFEDHEGKVVGENWIRLIEIEKNDPRFEQIGRLEKEIYRKYGKTLYYGWKIKRSYTEEELLAADILELKIASFINSAGEVCGTEYDETNACSVCGTGSVQISNLRLPLSKIPEHNDISRTISGEIVISRRLVDLLNKNSITGYTIRPIYACRTSGKQSNKWVQLIPKKCDIDIVNPTKIGINPFHPDMEGHYACTGCSLLGLNQLSELWINKTSDKSLELRASKQFIGVRRGMLRPERMLFISSHIWGLLSKNGIRGFQVEVAHFDGSS